MNRLIILVCAFLCTNINAQSSAEKTRILYGSCNKDSLQSDPFYKWFNTSYESYQPNIQVISELKNKNFTAYKIEIFFGTWCGDSKREVPRVLRLLNAISFPDKNLSLIAVGGSDSLVKQSPKHEEAGKGIFRVPTIIIYKNDKEVARINEYPVNSLEKDLQTIFQGNSYDPNYHSFSTIHKWLADGTLLDENISSSSLAGQLKHLVYAEYELNSLAYLLIKQEHKKEGLRLFQINQVLYPESSNVISSLGEGYFENGDYKKSVAALERSLELIKKPADIKPILEILYKAKERERSVGNMQ